MSKNSIEEDIAITKKLITTKFNNDYSVDNKDKEAIEHILTDYKKILKENEKLKCSIAIANTLEERIKENFIAKKKLEDFMENELPDDETCKRWDIYDVNGVYIKEELEKLLESEETNDKNNKKG